MKAKLVAVVVLSVVIAGSFFFAYKSCDAGPSGATQPGANAPNQPPPPAGPSRIGYWKGACAAAGSSGGGNRVFTFNGAGSLVHAKQQRHTRGCFTIVYYFDGGAPVVPAGGDVEVVKELAKGAGPTASFVINPNGSTSPYQ